MPGFSTSTVDKNAFETIVIVLAMSPAIKADLEWELELVVDLDFEHGVVVELESLQCDDEH
jgi:hypothetical protein